MRSDVLALVQAGGAGGRMDVLTRERAKPVLPYGGVHRLIDFTLTSTVHAGLRDVWVSVEYQVASLDEYLASGAIVAVEWIERMPELEKRVTDRVEIRVAGDNRREIEIRQHPSGAIQS